MLITNLHNLTQPLIRYELTDSFTARPGTEPGGYLRATVQGRDDGMLRYGGVGIHAHAVDAVLASPAPVIEYQVRQTERGIDVAVVAAGGLDQAALTAALRRHPAPGPPARSRGHPPRRRRHRAPPRHRQDPPLHPQPGRCRRPGRGGLAVEDRRVAVVTSASPGTGGPAARQLAAAGYPVFGASRTAPARGSAIEHVVIDVRDDAPARAGAAGIPTGSIGPQRARRLDRLCRSRAFTALREGDTGHGPPDLTGEDGLDPASIAALRSRPRPGTGPPRQRSRADPGRPALSPRELEVLRLLTDGASNPDISNTLHISRRTAEHHVEHILTKLDVTSRTAAVAYALTRELLAGTEPGATLG